MSEKRELLFEHLPQIDDLNLGDASREFWREYDFGGRVYHIIKPIGVYWRNGGSTHRVVDCDGITHCVPSPGVNGCVLRWSNPESMPVNW